MFKKHQLAVKVEKKNNDAPSYTIDPTSFSRKTAIVLDAIENVGKKVFLGVCIYVLLDTYRQVEVAKNTNHS